MSNPLSFSSFSKQQHWLLLAPALGMFAILALAVAVSSFFYLSGVQASMTADIKSGTLLGSELSGHLVQLNLVLLAMLAAAVSLVGLGGMWQHKGFQRLIGRYNDYLATLDANELKRFSNTPQVDDMTPALVASQLSKRATDTAK